MDPEPGFVRADGTITHHDLYDYLHLTQKGEHKITYWTRQITRYCDIIPFSHCFKYITIWFLCLLGYDRAFEPVNELLLQLLAEYESDSVRTEAEGACADWNKSNGHSVTINIFYF